MHQPFKPTPKNITYAAAPKDLVEAVRKELRRLVDEPNLDENLGTIARFANQADDMMMCVKAPEAVMKGEHAVTLPTVPTQPENAETYGSQLLRQLIPAVQNYQRAQQETPEAVVQAIILARRNGMTDVAAELEKKLLGKPLDGPRPVTSGIFGLDAYLPPISDPTKADVDGNAKASEVA